MSPRLALAILSMLVASVASAQNGPAGPAMKAARIHSYGGPDVFKYEDAPRPSVADSEVLVRVSAAGVNPVDEKIRDGSVKGWLNYTFPLILGFDVSGTVVEVGASVTRFKAGDEIYAYLDLARGGAYAEYCVVRETEAAPKPKKLTHEQAAGVPLAGLTAWQALVDTAKIEKGQTVLIHGGSGGVGHFAVQIAKAKGCRVIATASAENQAFLKELGADQAIDYKATKFEDVVKDVDAVLDTVGGDTQARSLVVLKKGGILVSIVGRPDPAGAEAKGVRAAGILVKPNASELGEIGALIDAGKIKPVISKTFPLKDAGMAHEQIKTRHTRGKIVLKVAD